MPLSSIQVLYFAIIIERFKQFSTAFSQPIMTWIPFAILNTIIIIVLKVQCCVHDKMAANATFHFLEDTSSMCENPSKNRLLQTVTRDKIRIFADYSQILIGDTASKNVIKRVVNISANFFYNTLSVQRLARLYFPADAPLQCNILNVPSEYQKTGVIGDLGVLIGNEDNNQTYVARSISCALMKSTNRPIWGVIIFNNRNLGYGQIQFQKSVSVAIHQMTHILGFSSALYQLFPEGNPFKVVNDYQYLSSPQIQQQIKNHFNCSSAIGLPLQDQDGTLNSSHQQRKVLGNEYMIAISKKQSFVSRFTLALLDSTGWYTVNYSLAEPTNWGKNKGCDFLDVDICGTEQFCSINSKDTMQLGCDWDGTAYGICTNDPFANSCNTINYYTNTICIDQFYEINALTIPMKANEKGGYNSRCFSSNIRATGIVANVINYRCYVTICSANSSVLYVKISSYILICRSIGSQLPAPIGMQGTLKCPNYKNYCLENKKTCAYHCNKNGVCINGMCLCTGAINLTTACLDQSNLTTFIGNTGGLTKAIIYDDGDTLNLINSNSKARNIQGQFLRKGNNKIVIKSQSINIKCIQGSFFDPQFGQCVKCWQKFGCEQCTQRGCSACLFSNQSECSSINKFKKIKP